MGVSKVEYAGDALIDLTGDDVSEDTLLFGVRAHNAAGEEVVGTLKSIATSAVLAADGWTLRSDGVTYQQIVAAPGVKPDTAIVLVQGNIRADKMVVLQGNEELTFATTAEDKPTESIGIKIAVPV